MKIAIVTDDSGVKLPRIDRYRDRIGKGVNISKYGPLLEVLEENGLEVPAGDMENEELYRSVLRDFIRPARLMFAGMFGEVRVFSERLGKKHQVELLIISGRYGVVWGDQEIIPYNVHLKDKESMAELDRRTGFVTRVLDSAKGADTVLLLVNKEMVSYLLGKGLLDGLDKTRLIAVTSYGFREELEDRGHVFLHRTGVARIGRENREKILHILEES